ncbi:hypothetical protein EBF04_07015 [Streptomyces sp. I6]|nr:hypothetical protein EBF04_07015 [Streptomyces sp. I6]
MEARATTPARPRGRARPGEHTPRPCPSGPAPGHGRRAARVRPAEPGARPADRGEFPLPSVESA